MSETRERLTIFCGAADVSDAIEQKNGSRSLGGYSYVELHHGACYVAKVVCGTVELTDEAKRRGYRFTITEEPMSPA